MEQTTPQETDAVFEFPVKETQLRHYDILGLVTAAETVLQATDIFTAVKKEITTLGGVISNEKVLDNQGLAYSVNGVKRGFYFKAEFDLETKNYASLHEKLRIRKDLARFLIVKKRVKTNEEMKEEERVKNIITERKKKKMQKDLTAMEDKEKSANSKKTNVGSEHVRSTAKKPEATETPKETPVKKSSLEDINKGIDKLLSDDLDV
ncbi:MAG: 30S ribosomal protein S6 [Candidatus Kerfeldbacteria bacterium RIFOXYB2_FULL_38_14]|uniref:Small ribosomal subunit protein bS6 n=1 Tax=Candidatus Kerfeldbacteria bacterium RIFOXYB2_FULL_38_14 TaxID=1798547 RepID=A0A1G2BCK3_9BACT|nr:MAG: 30S ribosomal protein S6 [Candidatus Kerfeldbacteria bacterium RIFOXYB2_FULL_38_14]